MANGEKIRNILIGIGALTGLILGLVSQFKGEPVAEKTWTVLRGKVNKQANAINKMRLQIAHLEGFYEAHTSLGPKAIATASSEPKHSVTEVPKTSTDVDCSRGKIEVEGKCVRVPTKVATKVQKTLNKAKTEVLDAKWKLAKERERRKIEATKRKAAERKARRAQSQVSDTLQPLPKKLKDF